MSACPITTVGPKNLVLSSLGEESFQTLISASEIVELKAKSVLQPEGQPPKFVYFPEGGIISFTVRMRQSGNAEFGVVGRESLSCFSGFLPAQASPVTAVVQIGGYEAVRVPAATLRETAERHPDVQRALVASMYSFMAQMTMTALSNARHPLAARLARWLLMCNDRLDSDAIPLTHEFMAMMLGAQRTSVTSALHVLEGEGAIWARRGTVMMRDRRRLEEIAGEAYSPLISI